MRCQKCRLGTESIRGGEGRPFNFYTDFCNSAPVLGAKKTSGLLKATLTSRRGNCGLDWIHSLQAGYFNLSTFERITQSGRSNPDMQSIVMLEIWLKICILLLAGSTQEDKSPTRFNNLDPLHRSQEGGFIYVGGDLVLSFSTTFIIISLNMVIVIVIMMQAARDVKGLQARGVTGVVNCTNNIECFHKVKLIIISDKSR